MSASTTHTRPLVVPRSRMERQSQGRDEDDVGRDRTSSAASQRSSHQQLPPFRELLPPHLHDEIDASRYGEPSGHNSASAASPTFSSASSFGRPSPSMQSHGRARTMPSISEGFGDYHVRYQVPAVSSHSGARRPSLNHSQSSGYSSRADAAGLYRPARTTGTSLPPFSDIQSYSDRGIHSERHPSGHSSHYPASYTHGPLTHPDPERFSPGGMTPYSQTSGQSPQTGSPAGYGEKDSRSAAYHAHLSEGSPAQPPNFGVIGADALDARNKKRRGNLPKPVTDILRTWFLEHLDHPYPSEEDKQMFIARTGLSISQISNWFINARRRQLPALRNQVRAQDHERLSYDQTLADLDHGQSSERGTPPRAR